LLALACSKPSNDVALPEPASSLSHATAIPYELPKASAGSAIGLPGEAISIIAIRIAADGTLYVNEVRTADADLVDRLRASAAKGGGRVVISADTKTPYGRVIHVVDSVETAGAGPVAFGVSPFAPAPSPPSSASVPIPTRAPSWSCPFPPEADAAEIDSAAVGLEIPSSPTGRPST
jgi:biopolymer transport protein ExbD